MKSIFTSDEQKEKAEILKAEFNEKLKQLVGSNYCVEIRKIVPPPVKDSDGFAKIYPHFCETIPYSKELQECIEGTIAKLYESGLSPSEAKKPGLLLGKSSRERLVRLSDVWRVLLTMEWRPVLY
ncbi:hypothetical protein [uncultured Fibrobacter sp.]|uniref:hypothetical protein n=1 Tax=uncultured Fibrobacter sp. TaxID=261512 RepID=UPI0025DD61DF|nr:hypothetical protein [uncultured Fibrobacter sp.]